MCSNSWGNMGSPTPFTSMRFEFFENLSDSDAKAFLERFLEVESGSIVELLKQSSAEGINADFSIQSVGPLVGWVASKLATFAMAPDMRLPDWIRDTESYRNNLFELDDPSKILTLRASYYLGESFVRSHGSLY